jgi:hypothetical protein
MNTTSTPQYMAARNKANYKVTAKATVFNVHQETNMIVGTEEIVILDDVLFRGLYSEGQAEFEARKDIERMIKEKDELVENVKMEDIEVTSSLF